MFEVASLRYPVMLQPLVPVCPYLRDLNPSALCMLGQVWRRRSRLCHRWCREQPRPPQNQTKRCETGGYQHKTTLLNTKRNESSRDQHNNQTKPDKTQRDLPRPAQNFTKQHKTQRDQARAFQNQTKQYKTQRVPISVPFHNICCL